MQKPKTTPKYVATMEYELKISQAMHFLRATHEIVMHESAYDTNAVAKPKTTEMCLLLEMNVAKVFLRNLTFVQFC